jgi:hypothetical protein
MDPTKPILGTPNIIKIFILILILTETIKDHLIEL